MIFISSGAYNAFTNFYIGNDCKDVRQIKKMGEKGMNVDTIC
jgi:hypothetical protein